MTLVVANATFAGPAPSLAEICAEIEKICGQPVIAKDHGEHELREWSADIAFACTPNNTIEIYVFSPEKLAAFNADFFGELMAAARLKKLNDNGPSRTVNLRGYLGQELTLLGMAELALENLSGKLQFPFSSERRAELNQPITAKELVSRRRRAGRQSSMTNLVLAFALPIVVIWSIAVALIRLPFNLWRAWRMLS
ncbi:hypothetical protein [Anatilimnocola floriformis]|uniref:hypothetical protein n=1 Tax=Anatilimnocola floriformis TaxID=2948575 RepID=UPI0020C51B9E|nr:hypothetical protein [Anatilimnocola floriformis]